MHLVTATAAAAAFAPNHLKQRPKLCDDYNHLLQSRPANNCRIPEAIQLHIAHGSSERRRAQPPGHSALDLCAAIIITKGVNDTAHAHQQIDLPHWNACLMVFRDFNVLQPSCPFP